MSLLSNDPKHIEQAPPACVDCAFYRESWGLVRCAALPPQRDLITGKMVVRTDYIDNARSSQGICGPDASKFQKKFKVWEFIFELAKKHFKWRP